MSLPLCGCCGGHFKPNHLSDYLCKTCTEWQGILPKGYRRPPYVSDPEKAQEVQQRWEAYREA